MDFPDETESKMIQLVSRAEKAEARVAELEAMLPSALKARMPPGPNPSEGTP